MHPLQRHTATVVGSLALVAPVMATAPHAGAAPTPTITVTRHDVVIRSTLPSCASEDGGPVRPCSWNINSGDGNGRGLAYWIDPHGATHYVWTRSAQRHGWEWLSYRDARRLGSTGHRSMVYWLGCVIRFEDDAPARLKCPDGYRHPYRR